MSLNQYLVDWNSFMQYSVRRKKKEYYFLGTVLKLSTKMC